MHHEAFLDVTGASPLTDFTRQLLSVIAKPGSVVVWNQGFEGARMRELAERFPEHAEALRGIVENMVDLLPIYRAHYYHRDMRGSWSIKSVLPTIAPDLDYGDLEVSGGGEAQEAYLAASNPVTQADERERLRVGLLEYCERDTWAMVRLAHWDGRFEQGATESHA